MNDLFAPYIPTRNSSRLEMQEIKARLKVRLVGATYSVFTTIHGTGVWKWIPCTEQIAHWYIRKFKLTLQIGE